MYHLIFLNFFWYVHEIYFLFKLQNKKQIFLQIPAIKGTAKIKVKMYSRYFHKQFLKYLEMMKTISGLLISFAKENLQIMLLQTPLCDNLRSYLLPQISEMVIIRLILSIPRPQEVRKFLLCSLLNIVR